LDSADVWRWIRGMPARYSFSPRKDSSSGLPEGLFFDVVGCHDY